MGIEELLEKVHHKDIREHGTNIQDVLQGVRLELLAKHYANSLPEDKKAEFNKLNEFDKGVRMAENDYKLPHDYAEAFMMDVVHRVLQGAAPVKAELMKKQMDILAKKDATPEQKRDAHREIDHFMAIAQSYGIRMDELEKGKVNGFSPKTFENAIRQYGQTYMAKEQSYWLKQIDNDMANKYIEEIGKHPDLKEFNTKLATDKDTYIDEKRGIIAGHYMAKKDEKEGGLETFKKSFDKYFKTYDKDKPADTPPPEDAPPSA